MTSLGHKYKYFGWSLRAALIVVMLSIFLNFTGISASAIDWGDPNLDDGVSMFFEQEQPFISKPGNRILRFKYPMVQNGSVTFKLQRNGTDLIQFMDSVSADGDLSLDNVTYTLINASGIITTNDEKWYQEGDRRVLELDVDFTEGCIPTYVGHSNMNGTEGDTNGSFSVSLTPGDEGDPVDPELSVSDEDISDTEKRVTGVYTGDISDWKYIVWKAYIDVNDNDQFDNNERVALKDMVISESLIQASFVVQKISDTFPTYHIGVELTNVWEEGAILIPGNVDVIPPSGSEWIDEVWGNCYRVYEDDPFTFNADVKVSGNYDVSWELIKRGYIISVPDEPGYLDHPSVNANLNNTGGTITFEEHGVYDLIMTIRQNDKTHTANFRIRVYWNPVAHLNDDLGSADAVWNYSEYTQILISGRDSEAGDWWGDPWHELDHKRDRMKITPLDGQSLDSIHVMNTDYTKEESGQVQGNSKVFSYSPFAGFTSPNDDFRALAFTEPGRYELEYTIYNTAGKQGSTTQIIYITENSGPSIQASVEPYYFRSKEDNLATVSITGPYESMSDKNVIIVRSPDNATLGDLEYVVTWDSNNDGIFNNDEDKVWTYTMNYSDSDYTGSTNSYISEKGLKTFDGQFTVPYLGKYKIELKCKRVSGGTTLPTLDLPIASEAATILYTEVDNTPPSAMYSLLQKTKVDVVFASGRYSQNSALKAALPAFKAKVGSAVNHIDLNVQELKSAFDSEFALHTTWTTKDTDMDTHVYLLDASGREIDHIWYAHRQGTACTLDKDDTSGTRGGEWFTIDFPNLPSNVVTMRFSIHGFRGSSQTRIDLIDKKTNQTVTSSSVYVSSRQYVQIGHMRNTGAGWNFVMANGQVFQGSTATPLGEVLQDATWRDESLRFIIYTTDEIAKEFQNFNSSDFQYTLSKILDNNAYLCIFANNSNKAVMQRLVDLIQAPDGEAKGLLLTSGSAATDVDKTADWVIEIARRHQQPTDWLLVNTEAVWETTYSDDNKDIAFDATSGFDKVQQIQATKWRYTHDSDYFDNKWRTEAFSGIWLQDPVIYFKNPGLFSINYKRRDNPYPDNADPNYIFSEYRYWSTNYDPRILSAMNKTVEDYGIDPADSLTETGGVSGDATDIGTNSSSLLGSIKDGLLCIMDPFVVHANAVSLDPVEFIQAGSKVTVFVPDTYDQDAVIIYNGDELATVAPGESADIEVDFRFEFSGEPKVTSLQFSRNLFKTKISWSVEDFIEEFEFTVKSDGSEIKQSVDLKKPFKGFEVLVDNKKEVTLDSDVRNTSVSTFKLKAGTIVTVNLIGLDDSVLASLDKVVGVEDIYSSKAVNDNYTGSNTTFQYYDVMRNDVHDDRYDIPLITEVILKDPSLADRVKVSIVPLSSVTKPMGITSPQVIKVEFDQLYHGEFEFVYKYAKVREDLPQLMATAHVSISQTNVAPQVSDVDSNELKDLVVNSSGVLSIPFSKFVPHIIDPDTDISNIRVSAVKLLTAGTYEIRSDSIDIKIPSGFYGMISFEYCVSDGEAESGYAKVFIEVKRTANQPTAVGDSYSIEILTGETILTVIENDDLNSNTRVFIKDISNVMLNDFEFNDIVVSSGFTGDIPIIRFNIRDTSALSAGDVVSFEYTLAAVEDSALCSTARVDVVLTPTDASRDKEGKLYVHRRPLAEFYLTLDKTGNNITAVRVSDNNERSYDLDHSIRDSVWSESKPYSWKGLRAFEWSIRTESSNWDSKAFDAEDYSGSVKDARNASLEWINTKLQEYVDDNSIRDHMVYVQLRVKDIDGPNSEGVWSLPLSRMVGSGTRKPVALFRLNSAIYYIDSKSKSDFVSDFQITDLSYSPVGNPLTRWTWTFVANNGAKTTINGDSTGPTDAIKNTIVEQLWNLISPDSYNLNKSECKLQLVVTDNLGLVSDSYSLTFRVYKKNQSPEINIPDNSQLAEIEDSTLYEIDKGLDGVTGDDWGTASNTTYKGKIDFASLLSIKDDQLSTVKIGYVFSGQRVSKRLDYRDAADPFIERIYNNLNVGQAAFTDTVTDQGFAPGAYKLVVSVKDNPNEEIFGPNAQETAILQTVSNDKPYHLYVVPSLYVIPHYQFGDWVDGKYNITTGQTLEESGLTAEDIAPCTGDIVTIFADCNQYVTGVSSYRDLNKNGKYDEGDDMVVEMERGSSNPDGTIRWSVDVELEEVPDPIGEEILTHLEYGVTATTIWGSETGDVMRSKYRKLDMDAMATKLYDFNIQYVTDPDISTELADFIKEDANRTRLGGATVGDLAVAKDVFTVLPRKGYSFYFEIWSKGLTKDNDWVRITPKFYAIDLSDPNNPKVGTELTGYLQVKDKSWKSFQDKDNEELAQLYPVYYEGEKVNKLGSHAELNLPITLRSIEGTAQRWKGRYGLPSGSRFAPVGMDLTDSTEYKGDILICMNFKAVKKGVERVDYVGRRQWSKERELYKNDSKGFFVDLENSWRSANNNIGTIIVYDGIKNVEDEYSVSPTWKD